MLLLCRPYRAKFNFIIYTQGVALGCHMSPRWGFFILGIRDNSHGANGRRITSKRERPD